MGRYCSKEDSSDEESSTRKEKSLQFVQNWVESLFKPSELFKALQLASLVLTEKDAEISKPAVQTSQSKVIVTKPLQSQSKIITKDHSKEIGIKPEPLKIRRKNSEYIQKPCTQFIL